MKRQPWFLLSASLMWLLFSCINPSSNDQPLPRPTIIIVTATGPYFEGFETGGGWLVGEGTRSSGSVVDGRYLLTINEPLLFAWTHQQRIFGDGTYAFDTTLISGPEASAYGILFGADENLTQFHYALITGDGRYDIGYCELSCETQQSLIDGFTLNESLFVGINETNRVLLSLNQGEVVLTINGIAVSRLQDIPYQQGVMGFIGESSRFDGFQVAFDNLSIE